MAEASASEVKGDESAPGQEKSSTGWRGRYAGSAAEDFFKRLGALDFGNWILIFGHTPSHHLAHHPAVEQLGQSAGR